MDFINYPQIVICPFLKTKDSLHKVKLSLFTAQRHYYIQNNRQQHVMICPSTQTITFMYIRTHSLRIRPCKGTLQGSLGNLVWVSIIQLALGSSEPAIHSSLSSYSRCYSLYYVALLGMVVISVLICVPVATSAWTKLVQYIQLVIYSRILYLNIDWNSRAIHGSFLSSSLLLILSVIRGCL